MSIGRLISTRRSSIGKKPWMPRWAMAHISQEFGQVYWDIRVDRRQRPALSPAVRDVGRSKDVPTDFIRRSRYSTRGEDDSMAEWKVPRARRSSRAVDPAPRRTTKG